LGQPSDCSVALTSLRSGPARTYGRRRGRRALTMELAAEFAEPPAVRSPDAARIAAVAVSGTVAVIAGPVGTIEPGTYKAEPKADTDARTPATITTAMEASAVKTTTMETATVETATTETSGLGSWDGHDAQSATVASPNINFLIMVFLLKDLGRIKPWRGNSVALAII
jgi:hypothetical protein